MGYDGSVLMTNDAAMSTGGTWYINDFAKNAPDVEVRYIKIPHAEGHEDASGTFHAPAYAILKGGAHEKETAMAINYLMNDARYEAIIDLGYIPVDEKYFDEFREKFVLVVGLQTVNNEHFQQENLTLAGVFLLSFPVIIFFMFTQKFFVQGIATSGIKS